MQAIKVGYNDDDLTTVQLKAKGTVTMNSAT
jgi:hypothetical protein